MKKKLFCILLAFLTLIFSFYNPMNVTATGIEALPFIYLTGWDSTISAYGALKGFQYGTTSDTPEIVGDYTKPYNYSNESIAPLKPSWDSYADNFFVNNWSDLYPVYSEADARKAWELEKKSFDEKIGLGNIDMNSYLYNVLNNWLPSLVGTDYIVSQTNYENFTLNNFDFPKSIPLSGSSGVTYVNVPSPPDAAQLCGLAVSSTFLASGEDKTIPLVIGYFKDGSIRKYQVMAVQYANSSLPPYVYSSLWVTTTSDPPALSDDMASFGTDSNGQIITNTDSFPILGSVEESEPSVISQMPVGNPNDNDDKDNRKISVLPNVPSISGNLNNIGNINNGQLPIKFPSPDQNGLIPSIPVLGNGGITVNIPITNNNYEVINNYDDHQEIYNNNYSYPTINYNYVNYYVNEGAITYEQFLQALQKYFNVIVYNNETNNYYPITINNTTNNYYTIEEVINEEIPPILPPAKISITDRFPFCLPFDIYKILKLLNEEPTPWEWDVPVPTFVSGGTSNEYYHGDIGHVDFSETMHISLEEWDPVAKVLRTCLSVLWLVFLCFLFWKLGH